MKALTWRWIFGAPEFVTGCVGDNWQMHNMEKSRSGALTQGIQAETERWNLGSHEKCNGMR